MSAEKRLINLVTEISTIFNDSQVNSSFDSQYKSYCELKLLINEASNLLDKLIKEISDLDLNKAHPSHIEQTNQYIDDLSSKNLTITELMDIVAHLKLLQTGFPTNTMIINNVQQHVIYEEQDIE